MLVRSASFREKILSHVGAALIRLIGLTLRIRVEDKADSIASTSEGQFIFLFWHNRMFVMPLVYSRCYRAKRGVVVLTSASGDGALISEFMKRFGMGAIRGSSSRRGATAVRELHDQLRQGNQVIITPDGPRGPRYRLGPGAILLSQLSGAPIIPIQIEYSSCIRFNRWDRFMMPLPFSRVEILFGPAYSVPPGTGEAGFEAERLRVEELMQPATP